MKTKFFKAAIILTGLLLVNVSTMSASIGEKFNQFMGSEFSNYQGLYIIAGIVIASLVLYVIVNHFNKEEEEHHKVHHGTHYHHHRRHHAHKIIKKTS